jgi:hypothetical protein
MTKLSSDSVVAWGTLEARGPGAVSAAELIYPSEMEIAKRVGMMGPFRRTRHSRSNISR